MAIEKQTKQFASSNGKDQVVYDIYLPERPAKGVLQVSHGMCEWFGRYEAFARFLAEQGFIVCGNDHLGHGRTAKSNADLGYFAPAQGWRYLVQDLAKLTDLLQPSYPDLPYFLLGHSMGSFLARAYLTEYGQRLSGAIIMGTSGKNPLAGLGILLLKLLKLAKGERHRSQFLQSIAFYDYNKRFQPQKSEHDWLSRDIDLVAQYEKEPWCNFIFTLSGFDDLFHMLQWVSRVEWSKEVPVDLPILLVSGEDDPVGNYGKGVLEVYQKLLQAGCTKVQQKLYPAARHELLNESNREEVYQDLLHWLELLCRS